MLFFKRKKVVYQQPYNQNDFIESIRKNGDSSHCIKGPSVPKIRVSHLVTNDFKEVIEQIKQKEKAD